VGDILKGKGGAEVIRGHFSPGSPVFPEQMTLFHEKMTPLFEETPVSVSDEWESALSSPRNRGRLH
jgi:hypothetical protein